MKPTARHLVIYPVKSAAGIEVPHAEITPEGLRYRSHRDHEYMIVRAAPDKMGAHAMVSQRDNRGPGRPPQELSIMALIKPKFIDDVVSLTWDHTDTIPVTPGIKPGKDIPVKIWDGTYMATDMGNQLAEWASDHLEYRVRVVKAAGRFKREVSTSYAPNENAVLFQDGYPIHWFSIESVQELSCLAEKEIPWKSFRPQIVVEGMPAQYEHKIATGTLSDVPFTEPKPCDRCPMTMVDQETGRLDPSHEPLATLAKYKQWRDRHGMRKVIFGENMLPLGYGRLTTGSVMDIGRLRNPPLVYGELPPDRTL